MHGATTGQAGARARVVRWLWDNAAWLKLILIRSRLAPSGSGNRKRASVTPASAAPDQTAWLPQPCSPSDMAAATMQYEEAADLVSGATAAAFRDSEVSRTPPAPGIPVQDQLKLTGIGATGLGAFAAGTGRCSILRERDPGAGYSIKPRVRTAT